MDVFPDIAQETRMVVLTGAGISAESGVPTFRDKDGIWGKYDVTSVATPEGFARDPGQVWRFYNERRKQAQSVKPNAGHYALVRLEEFLPEGRFTLITQNVDHLHRKAGSRNVHHMHGELAKVRCTRCEKVRETLEDLPELPRCECGGLLRPHVVWFGEVPFDMDRLFSLVEQCDLFLVVGTSGVVHPAAGFVIHAKRSGATTVGVNLEVPENRGFIDHFYQGKSGEILPRLVEYWARCLIA
jgi:NAD-dependent deacetylase